MPNLKTKIVFWIVTFILILGLPLFIKNDYFLHLIISACIWSILAISLNMLLGYAGQISVAHGAFYGIGAYTSALLTLKANLSFWIALPLAGTLAGILGFLIGVPAFRTKALYFAIATLGVSLICHELFLGWRSLTGGVAGVTGIPLPNSIQFPFIPTVKFFSKTSFYYLVLFLLVAVIFLSMKLVRSELGSALKAIRDDEILAKSVGIRTIRYKLFSFVFASFFAGIAGSFYAHYMGFISPETFGLMDGSFQSVVVVVIGGMGTLLGPMIGAFFLVILPEVLRVIADYRLMIYSVAIVLTIIYMPNGLFSLFSMIVLKTKRKSQIPGKKPQGTPLTSSIKPNSLGLLEKSANGVKPAQSHNKSKETILEVKDVSKHFKGVIALDKINTKIYQGEIFGIIGPNGAGKTTLINTISGMLHLTGGELVFKNGWRTPWNFDQAVSLGIARTFQHSRVFPNLTVYENIKLGQHLYRKNMIQNVFDKSKFGYKRVVKDQNEVARGVLELLGLTDHKDDIAGSLRYGLTRILGIGIALSTQPELLLLDEPAAGMTPEEMEDLSKIIRVINRDGITIGLIDHNMRFLMNISDRVMAMDYGKKIVEGYPEEIQRNEQVINLYLGETGDVKS